MNFLTGIGSFAHSVGYYVIPSLFVFTLIVFVHEMGHFLAARFCGVTVDAFSIGFGRQVVGWTDSRGTRWKIGWLPFGGYVKFRGDENAASMPDREKLEAIPLSERAGLFHFKPVWQRAIVVAAGPIANFILAIVVFAALFMFVGKIVATPVVDGLRANSVAEAAGFKIGDRILSIDGTGIETFEDMQRIVSVNTGDVPLSFKVLRAGHEINLIATPRVGVEKDPFGNETKIARLGIERTGGEPVRFGPLTSVWLGVKEVWFSVDRTFSYLGGLLTGREDTSQIRGVLGVGQLSGQAAAMGFTMLILMAAAISVNIGLVNLFPVPLLDGGHLLYYAIEAVRGRPMSAKMQELGFKIGLALVMMLMIFANGHDLVVRFQVFSFISKIFS